MEIIILYHFVLFFWSKPWAMNAMSCVWGKRCKRWWHRCSAMGITARHAMIRDAFRDQFLVSRVFRMQNEWKSPGSKKKKSGITASAWPVGINYESWIVMNCHELSTISRYLIVFRGCFGYLGPHNMVIFWGTSVQLKLEMWPWPPTRLFKVFAPCHIA